jgi:KDO2-lipid IV(A) lauroyltransferase
MTERRDPRVASVDAGRGRPRGTLAQRARAAALAALAALFARLPLSAVYGLADTAGELTYRLAGSRADVPRGNLAHVVARLAVDGRGSARSRAAATDPGALEDMVRASFRHAARTYAETLRGAPAAGRDIRERLVLDAPDAVVEAVAGGGPMIFTTLHFGSMMAEIAFLAERVPGPVTAPMETIADPELQEVLRRSREGSGVRTVDLSAARRELTAALARGEGVGIVADRDITGGGLHVPLFGLPARMPIGPALLALETGAPLQVGAVRRLPDGRYRGRLVGLAHPPADLPRRARVEALLAAMASAFEDVIATAPEQWWAVLHPIWQAVGPLERRQAASRNDGAAGIRKAPPEVDGSGRRTGERAE